jgi:LEA14-like dessication related protein
LSARGSLSARCGRWAAAALLLLLASCGSGDPLPPHVQVVNMHLLESSLFEQRFQVDLRIGNPNDFDLPLDGLTFDLDVNGEDFARGFSDQRVTVPRLGEARLSVVASTTLLDLVRQFTLLAERGALAYRLHGTAYLNSLAVRQAPYESEGTFRLLSGDRSADRSI